MVDELGLHQGKLVVDVLSAICRLRTVVGHVDKSHDLIASQYWPARSPRSEMLTGFEQVSNAIINSTDSRVLQERSELGAESCFGGGSTIERSTDYPFRHWSPTRYKAPMRQEEPRTGKPHMSISTSLSWDRCALQRQQLSALTAHEWDRGYGRWRLVLPAPSPFNRNDRETTTSAAIYHRTRSSTCDSEQSSGWRKTILTPCYTNF